MELLIKRSEWLRGKDSLLLDSNNKKCCLGFLSLYCGASEEQIIHKKDPFETPHLIWPKDLQPEDFNNSSFADYLMGINDNSCLSDQTIETKLTKAFNSIGIKVVFID